MKKTKAEKAAYMREWYRKNKAKKAKEIKSSWQLITVSKDNITATTAKTLKVGNTLKINVKGAGRKGISYKKLYEGTVQDYRDYVKEMEKEVDRLSTFKWGTLIWAIGISFILGYIIK